MKIHVHSTAPWSPSSYSVLVGRTIPNIVREGHEVVLGTWYGLQGQPLPWQIQPKNGRDGGVVTVMPSVNGAGFAHDTLLGIYEYYKSDVLITISDVWPMEPNIMAKTNFCPWFPVDADPVPQPILKSLEPAVYPMVYSKWGVQKLAEVGIKAKYVPCSAPADLYKPGDKMAARRELHFPEGDLFIVSMVAANKDPHDRKGFAEGMAAFAKFAESHDNARLYLHTNWSGTIDIPALIKRLNLYSKVVQPDPFALSTGMLDDNYMVRAYQATDVLLNPCKSEGFGLPLVEAQMTGVPIIATDFATTDELLFAGWKVDGQLDWYNGINSWRKRVYIDSVVDALEDAYSNRGNEKLCQKARNGAMRFDNDTVFNQYWRPALADIEAIVTKSHTVNERANGQVMVPVP